MFPIVLSVQLCLFFGLTADELRGEDSRIAIELREASGIDLDGALVELIRLSGDGSPRKKFSGPNAVVPYGRYRVEVLMDGLLIVTTTVDVAQPELRVKLGVSLLNCCMNVPGVSSRALGEIHGTLSGFDFMSRTSVSLLPLWSNNYNISVQPSALGDFKFYPIDLGQYLVVVSRDSKILDVREVSLTEHGPAQRIEFQGDSGAGKFPGEPSEAPKP